MKTEEIAGVFNYAGGVQLSPNRQSESDFDLLINFDISDNELRPRPGWRCVRYVDNWTTTGSPSRYTPNSYAYLGRDNVYPLGSYLYSSPSGSDYFIYCYRDLTSAADPGNKIYAVVHDTTGKLVSPSTVLGHELKNSGGVGDPTDQPYTFTTFGRYVYFSNGGTIWRWSERSRTIEDAAAKKTDADNSGFRKNPMDENQHIYLTDMKGATIVQSHGPYMIYAGFKSDWVIGCNGVIDSNGDGLVTIADAKDGDGYKLTDGKDGLHVQPYLIAVSDPRLPRCCKVARLFDLPSTHAVTGVAAFNQYIVVFSETEMYVTTGELKFLKKFSSSVGCVAHRTIAQTPNGLLMWLASDGVYSWDGSSLPKKMTMAVDPMFRQSASFSIPSTVSSVSADLLQLPFSISGSRMKWATSAINRGRGFYAVSLSGGSSIEDNNLTVCISYLHGGVWFYVSPTQSKPDAGSGSAAAGIMTLMSSPREPDLLYAQGFCVIDPSAAPKSRKYKTCMLVGNGKNDQFYDDGAMSERQFDCLAVSRRVYVGDSRNKTPRRAHIRMYGTRDHDFLSRHSLGGSADTNKAYLVYMPELSPFDKLSQDDTVTTESSVTINPWPDQQIGSKNFWQASGATSVSVGRYDNGSTEADKYWYASSLFDKRVDFKSSVCQFARFAIYKKIDSTSGPSIRIVSLSVGTNRSGTGTRK